MYDLAINMDEEEHKRKVRKFTQLTETAVDYLVQEMNILQMFITDMNDLPRVLQSVVGAIVEVEITYRDNYKYPVPRFTKLIYKPPVPKAAYLGLNRQVQKTTCPLSEKMGPRK